MSEFVDIPFAVTLGSAALWTTLFSLSSSPSIRGYRNLGLLATYLAPMIFLFIAGWRAVLITWALFGIAGGVQYMFWELVQRLRTPAGEAKDPVNWTHLVFGLVAWPIMMPEAIEYLLAEFGVLPTPAPEVVDIADPAPQPVDEERPLAES